MTTAKETFTAQATPELLAVLRDIALAQERDFDDLLDDIFQQYLANMHPTKIRSEARSHFRDSLDRNGHLYQLLAQ